MCWRKTVAKFLYGVIQYLHEENRSWFTNSKHFSKRMNEHFGLCSQWKSRCPETLMQLDAKIDDATATTNQIYHISAWQSQWRHRLWRRELHMNLSRVSYALCGPRCLVPRPHYSARPKRFGPCGPSEVNWPRGSRSETTRSVPLTTGMSYLTGIKLYENFFVKPPILAVS